METTKWMRTTAVATLAMMLIACGSQDEPKDNDNDEPNGDSTEAVGELLEGDAERDSDPQVAPDLFEQFTADNRDFAFSLLDQIRQEEGDDENVFLSPHSISLALAMTYVGARGDTKAQMADVLRFQLDDDDLHPAFNKLDLALKERSEIETDDGDAFELEVVNQTWGQVNFPFAQSFLDTLSLHYGAAMYVVDFVTDYEEIREAINAWVEEQTNDRIKDLLPDGSLDDYTRKVLVNAIYFYGSWDTTFDENRTSDEEFSLLDGSTTQVELMRHDDPIFVPYFADEDTVAVALPYVGEEVSMVAVKPADDEADFLQWEEDFDRQAFDAVVDGFSPKQGWVHFPKFEDEGDYSLVDPLEALGMVDAFDDMLSDFGGMLEPEFDEINMTITDIFHKTFVSVDEEGTEAAAATAVVVGTDSAPMADFEISFDRPFYYAVYDHPTDTILFLGRMVAP